VGCWGYLLMNDEELLRYSRQILLQGFDVEGQEKLAAGSVLLIGAGGLGCPAAMYLASSGVGHLVICDDDDVELSNLQRQIGHATSDIGKPKVVSLQETLLALNPAVRVTAISHRLSPDELDQWIGRVDLVLDCTDNFESRFLLNEHCYRKQKPLVSGAAVRSEGQLAVFDFRQPESACYCCLYPDVGREEAANCSENGVLAPLVGVIGSLQALEAIKLLSGYGESSSGRLLVMDVRYGEWRELVLKQRPRCPICSGAAG
jgi:molybdopterin/thiamine biosynthesis adenylyltransferase